MINKGNVWIIILVAISFVAIIFGAYVYGQNQSLKKTGLTRFPTSSPIPSAFVLASTSPQQTVLPNSYEATIVFEAEGSFTPLEKDELKKKVINPFTDYYKTESDQILLTLTLAKNDQTSKDQYPYKAQAIFQGGGNMGFLIAKSGVGIDWWFPECLTTCNLSASFKVKYPEISSKVQ